MSDGSCVLLEEDLDKRLILGIGGSDGEVPEGGEKRRRDVGGLVVSESEGTVPSLSPICCSLLTHPAIVDLDIPIFV